MGFSAKCSLKTVCTISKKIKLNVPNFRLILLNQTTNFYVLTKVKPYFVYYLLILEKRELKGRRVTNQDSINPDLEMQKLLLSCLSVYGLGRWGSSLCKVWNPAAKVNNERYCYIV